MVWRSMGSSKAEGPGEYAQDALGCAAIPIWHLRRLLPGSGEGLTDPLDDFILVQTYEEICPYLDTGKMFGSGS